MNIGVKKSFANNRFTFSVMANDIFNGYGVPMRVNYGGQSMNTDMFIDQRGVRCTLSYKFGKQTVKRANEKYDYDRNKGRING